MSQSCLQQQLAQQSRWKLRPERRNHTLFDELLQNEFLDADQRQTNLERRLRELITYAIERVPYYQTLDETLELSHRFTQDRLSGFEALRALPILNREVLHDDRQSLITTRLPQHQSFAGLTKTSGSTGQPVVVQQTHDSSIFFSILKQREYRAWSFDPSGKLASIRPASDLLLARSGEQLQDQTTLRHPGWEYVSDFFQTGEMVMVTDTSGTDFLVEWLEQQRPDYLIAMSAVLEQLALCYSDAIKPFTVTSALAISQQLTDEMRNLVQTRVAHQVEQNYGLNEFGLIAMRCPHSGYYHVHNELAYIEVVDEAGQPCEPGSPGKLLVTGMANLAMPLLRYDTDDLAELPSEACPCGRSMQSFINLRGRYRRTAHLPEGTWAYWDALLRVFGQAPSEQMAPVKQYQLHQLSADHYHLNFKIAAPLGEALKNEIRDRWAAVAQGKPAQLEIFELDKIEMQGKKFQNFISDIAPPE